MTKQEIETIVGNHLIISIWGSQKVKCKCGKWMTRKEYRQHFTEQLYKENND